MIIIEQRQSIQDFWDKVCKENNVQNNRQRYNVIHRHAFAVACLDNTMLSMKTIGSIIGRDHATVIHSRKNHKWNAIHDKTYIRLYHFFSQEVGKCAEEYDAGLQEVISNRVATVGDDSLVGQYKDSYERKIKRLQDKYETELEVLRHKLKATSKALKRADERNVVLNNECLRLKNLL